MMLMKVMIIHLIPHQCSSWEESEKDPIPSTKYPPHQYVLMTDACDPSCYEEVVSDEHKNEWSEPMQDEMKS
jgi:hypothetical protein